MSESAKVLEELIYNLGYPVFNNQWIIYEESDLNTKREFYQVKSVELPNLFPKFETGTLPTGVQYYTGVEFDKDWSITIEEDTNLSAYEYFRSWVRSVYKSHRFQLSGGDYVKNFSIALLSPSTITSLDIASITNSRLQDWGVSAANQVLSSAVGRLATRASTLLAEGITRSGAGVTAVQRTAGNIVDIVSGSLQAGLSEGFGSLMSQLNLHSDDVLLTISMSGTLIKSIEKLTLEYGEGDPIQWKVSFASDTIRVSTGPGDIYQV